MAHASTAKRSVACGEFPSSTSIALLLSLTARRAAVIVAASQPGAGLGLFYRSHQRDPLPKGTFICLYAGEYLSETEARRRLATQAAAAQAGDPALAGQGNYILSLRLPGGTTHIDARHIGNVGRILNHSCEPNCVILPVRWGTGPDVLPRAAIFVSLFGWPDDGPTKV